jgi:aspartyl-tRNA(Asn)/glutamyl-tRNA(Gln) amidotransferase subunit A
MTPRSVREIREAFQSGRTSARAIVADHLARIERLDPALNAFLTIASDRALARADALDGTSRARDLPLAAVPVAVKDNICTAGLRTTAGSRALEHFVPPYDATVVARLESAGAIVIGKTNCDEFGMGSSNENSAFGPVRNPWALDRTPGGSSGGSAAAVAARLVPVALGSDTGGSVRQPAAFCGIVGLKPTYGRVSRYGLIAFGSSLEQVGTMARTVEDAATVFDAIAGWDARDSTSSRQEAPRLGDAVDGPVSGLTVGVPSGLLAQGVDPLVLEALRAATEALRALGVLVREVDLPHARHAVPVYYLVATAEASSNLARYDGVRYGFRAPSGPDTGLGAMYDRTRELQFGAEVKRRIMLGTYVLSAGYYEAYYRKAQQVRTLIRQDYDRAFGDVDAVLLPVSPVPPFKLGERTADPLQMYLADVFTVSANLAGLPALSVPCGFSGTPPLPLGCQFVGRAFAEATLVRLAAALERARPWHHHVPPRAAG